MRHASLRAPQIFAVLQWELADGVTEAQAAEKVADLDFDAVVRATDALVLVGTHVEEVAQLSTDDTIKGRLPEAARQVALLLRVVSPSHRLPLPPFSFFPLAP